MNFFNRQNVINQALYGYVASSGGKLALVTGTDRQIIVRSDYQTYKNEGVAIVSGGGSGHEPLHAGFVGGGMLTAAVCGEIFASPSVNAVLSAILLVTGEKGCLLIVKNYTGDRLNFALAAEQARSMGKQVEILLVADDIAIENPEKRRGIAGCVLIHKIAGAFAQQGLPLQEIKQKCERAAAGLYTLGITIAGADSPSESESESASIKFDPQLGRGIHNEEGEKVIFQTEDIATETVDLVLNFLATRISHNRQYAVLLNNLGSVSQLEMSIVTDRILNSELKGLIRYFIGPATFCTSLNQRGFSLSLLALTEEIEEALLFPVTPRNWVHPIAPVTPKPIDLSLINIRPQYLPSEHLENRKLIAQISEVLIKSKSQLNDLDSHGGDKDAGETLALAATTIKHVLDENRLPLDCLSSLLSAIGEILANNIGGTSGVLLSILFTNAGTSMGANTNISLANALMKGTQVMIGYAGSKVGDRSMLDALVPALDTLERQENLQLAAAAARIGAEKTATMIARVGRAANVSPEIYSGFNDAGAEAVALIFESLVDRV